MSHIESKKIRVLQLTSSIGFYGVERMILTLFNAFDSRFFKISVGAIEKKGQFSETILEEIREAGGEAYSIPCRGRLDWGAVKHLVSLIHVQAIDVLHSHEPKSRLYGAIAAGRTKIPHVTTQHNWTRGSLVTTLAETLDILSLRWTERAVAVSSIVAAEMRRVGIASERIKVIPNGIDLAGLRNTGPDPELRTLLGLPNIPVVGTLGRLDHVKGHALLLEAARLIADAGVDAAYLIVGEGSEKKNLETLARNLGLADRVYLAGYQRNVSSFYALMDIFVLPSQREGTPMALLEAMAMVKPVVATPVGGVPDIVTDGVHGLLLTERKPKQLAEAILRLLREPETAQCLAAAGRRRVEEEFSAGCMAKQYEKIYLRCKSQHDSRHRT